jgi:hypothetical protein
VLLSGLCQPLQCFSTALEHWDWRKGEWRTWDPSFISKRCPPSRQFPMSAQLRAREPGCLAGNSKVEGYTQSWGLGPAAVSMECQPQIYGGAALHPKSKSPAITLQHPLHGSHLSHPDLLLLGSVWHPCPSLHHNLTCLSVVGRGHLVCLLRPRAKQGPGQEGEVQRSPCVRGCQASSAAAHSQ